MDIIEYANGQPCWVDLMTNDVDAAVEYYSGLFGWEFAPAQGDDNYRLISIGGKVIAAVWAVDDVAIEPTWRIFFSTDDLAATCEAVVHAGGSVEFGPETVGGRGSYADCRDAVGGAFIAWQGDEQPGSEVTGVPGSWMWSEYVTRHVQQTTAFYGSALGWEFESAGDGYQVFKVEAQPFGGILPAPAEMPEEFGEFWTPYFYVEDIDAAVEYTQATGGEIIYGPAVLPDTSVVVELTHPSCGFFYALKPGPGMA